MDEFEYKGFKYRIVSVVDATVELISAGKLTGKIVVPEEVEYQNQKCKVVAIRGAKKTEYYDYQPDDKRRKVERRSREVTCPVFVGQSLQSFQDKLEVVLPKSLKEIGDYAFYICYNLVSVNIPVGVTSIGKSAFDGCRSLTSVHITDLAAWCNIDFGDSALSGPHHNLYLNGELVTDLVIPNSVTSIGRYAFCGCKSLTSITIPNSVTSIGKYAFKGCSSLTSVAIPNSVTSIGVAAFYKCSSLTSVAIGNSVTRIELWAFSGCSSLTSITIPDSVTMLGEVTFEGCSSLTSVTIPDSVTMLRKETFEGCSSLTSVTIPNSVINIRKRAFYSCKSLTSITIPNSVTSIGDEAFYDCESLTSVTIENKKGKVAIGENAFPSNTKINYPTLLTKLFKRSK